MGKNIFILGAISMWIISCNSLKKIVKHNRSEKVPIQIAILDFSKTGKLFKENSVFSVSFHDTLYRMVLDKSNSPNYAWVRGQIYEGVEAVSIIGSNNQFLLRNAIVGSKGKLPSRFIEKNGKLFYWFDNDYPLTENVIATLKKYNLLKDDRNEGIKAAVFFTDGWQKGAHYYFCKEDLSKCKKVITSIALGYYDAPNLNCSKNHQ